MINKAKLIPILFAAPLLLMANSVFPTPPEMDIPYVPYYDAEVTSVEFFDTETPGAKTVSLTINNTGNGFIFLRDSYFRIGDNEEEYYLGELFVDQSYTFDVEYLRTKCESVVHLKYVFFYEFDVNDINIQFYAITKYKAFEVKTINYKYLGHTVNKDPNYYVYSLDGEFKNFDRYYGDLILIDLVIKDKPFVLGAETYYWNDKDEYYAEIKSFDGTLHPEKVDVKNIYGVHIEKECYGPCEYPIDRQTKNTIATIITIGACIPLLGAAVAVPLVLINRKKNKKEA